MERKKIVQPLLIVGTPGTLAGRPPQANDAKCGFTCHTIVKTRDYVFTEYGKR
jgi:hypothetical protein